MKICFVLSDVKTEDCETSVIILKKAHQRGHEVYVMGVGEFEFNRDEGVNLLCSKIPKNLKGATVEEFWKQVQDNAVQPKIVHSTEMDILFLRNNPTQESAERQWATESGIAFGRLIQKQGVLVLNDAVGLSKAFIDKLYFEELPAEIKPDSVITRNKETLMKFWRKHNKEMILKPLEGSRGKDVYKITQKKRNLQQIMDTLLNQGYVIAQEYIPEAKKGDNRVLMMNGKILEENGQAAIIHRHNKDKGEFRSNIALGATPKRGERTPEIEHIASVVGPNLIRDGLFFVGLDIIKDKLIEINVLSPGDMHLSNTTGMPDFTDSIVDALERKVDYKNKNNLSNSALATKD